jgi:acyl carrier protein
VRICSILNLSKNRLNGQSRTDDLGLDSITRASLLVEIERKYDCVIEQDALFDYPTIQALAQHIASLRTRSGHQ